MRIRLPGRDNDSNRIWRQAGQHTSELQGAAVQRRRGRAVAEPGGESRRLSGKRLGTARPARQRLRVVPGLVSSAATGRDGSRYLRRQGRIPGAPGRLLGGRGVAVPVGLPQPVRAGASKRPHRVSGCRHPALAARPRAKRQNGSGPLSFPILSAWPNSCHHSPLTARHANPQEQRPRSSPSAGAHDWAICFLVETSRAAARSLRRLDHVTAMTCRMKK